MLMARHWGGDGIEEYLEYGESVRLRYTNFFLTQHRVGIYLAMKSKFLLTDYSDVSVKENNRNRLRLVFISFSIILALIFAIGEVYQPTSLMQGIILFTITFLTIGTGYALLASFDRDSYLVYSTRYKKSWKIRTLATEQGLTFVDELLKAINSQKNVNEERVSSSSQ